MRVGSVLQESNTVREGVLVLDNSSVMESKWVDVAAKVGTRHNCLAECQIRSNDECENRCSKRRLKCDSYCELTILAISRV